MSDATFQRPEDWNKYADVEARKTELRTWKEQVAYILNRYPETRNSDRELFLRHLEEYHGLSRDQAPLLVTLDKAVPTHSVLARARAQLQNTYGLYLPTRPDVLRHRQGRRREHEAAFVQLASDGAEEVGDTVL